MNRLPVRIRRVVEALRPYEPDSVLLFGSWARGEADELSDVDLVIIKATSVPFLERLREAGKLLPASAGAVDLLVYTPEEFRQMRREGNAFAEMLAEEAVLVYGRNPEVNKGVWKPILSATSRWRASRVKKAIPFGFGAR